MKKNIGKTIERGGYGVMKRCKSCGQMPRHFGWEMFGNGVCPSCGEMDIERVVARVRWHVKKSFFFGDESVYHAPEVKYVIADNDKK